MKKAKFLTRLVKVVCAVAVLAVGAFLVTKAKTETVEAAPVTPVGVWSDYADDSWYDTGNARYANYGGHVPGESKDFPLLIKTSAEFAYLEQVGPTGELSGKVIKVTPSSGELDFSAHYWVPVNLKPISEDKADAIVIYAENTVFEGVNINQYVQGTAVNIFGSSNGYSSNVPIGASGLFGSVYNAQLRYFALHDVNIQLPDSSGLWDAYGYTAFDAVGGLVGYAYKSTITYNRVLEPNIQVSSTYGYVNTAVGGLIGYADRGNYISTSEVCGGLVLLTSATYGTNDYVAGAVGAMYRSIISNTWTSGDVQLKKAGDDWVFGGYVAGIVAYASSVDPFHVYQTCLTNSFSTANITVDYEGYTVAGGLVAHLNDLAVNNYYNGDISIAPQESGFDIGQLFGEVDWNASTDESPDAVQEIHQNYYNPNLNDGLDAIGYEYNSYDWSYGGSVYGVTYAPFTSIASLRNLLEAGRADVIAVAASHDSSVYSSMEEYTEHWRVASDYNNGLPFFGVSPTITGVMPDSGALEGGDIITVYGNGFKAFTSEALAELCEPGEICGMDHTTRVYINGKECIVSDVKSSNELTCVVPASDKSGTFGIVAGEGCCTTLVDTDVDYTYVPRAPDSGLFFLGSTLKTEYLVALVVATLSAFGLYKRFAPRRALR